MRPKYIDRALDTLREVALTHRSPTVAGELLEISHYVAHVERLLEKAKRPTRRARFKAWWLERWRAGAAGRSEGPRMKLLLVDGSNIVMRCAFGGDIAPPEAIISAAAMIDRVARESKASHLVIAFDYPDEPTWRHKLYPDYKAGRKTDTAPWIIAAGADFTHRGWKVEFAPGFEADDVIATIALRTQPRAPVTVLSSDSDLLPLTVAGVEVLRPLGGQQVQKFGPADVVEKYKIPAAHLLYDFKAMTGEPGDNIPGVPGIGLKRAADLLHRYGSLESIIEVGKGGIEKYSAVVAAHEESARLSLRLVSLNPDAPVEPIIPSSCALRRKAA